MNLDGSTVGVVGPEGGGQAQEPGFGVLWRKGGERNEDESDERDCDGEVEPESERVCILVRLWG